MSTYELALQRRSIRCFENTPVPYEVLEKCVNAARLAPSGANMQPLEYIIADDEQILPQIFDCLRWARYIRPEGTPPPGHRPKAYIIILTNNERILKGWELCDVGLATENMILVALEEGIGTCCLGWCDHKKLRALLNVPENYTISLTLALGYPDEIPVVEEFKDSVEYWKDKDKVLHVPKKKLKEVLHRNSF